MSTGGQVLIAVYCYDGMTALDGIGPSDILNRVPGVTVETVGDGAGLKRAQGGIQLVAARDLDDLPHPEILLVPGAGRALDEQLVNERLLEWVRVAHATAQWTVSVCTGALILGASGVLKGRRATTHWRARGSLAKYGAEYVDERVVEDGTVMTCGGVTAGIDLALVLTERIAGPKVAAAVQLSAHYHPHPRFPPQHHSDAPAEIIAMIEHELGPI